MTIMCIFFFRTTCNLHIFMRTSQGIACANAYSSINIVACMKGFLCLLTEDIVWGINQSKRIKKKTGRSIDFYTESSNQSITASGCLPNIDYRGKTSSCKPIFNIGQECKVHDSIIAIVWQIRLVLKIIPLIDRKKYSTSYIKLSIIIHNYQLYLSVTGR